MMTTQSNLDAAVERLIRDLKRGQDNRPVGDPVWNEFAAHIDTVSRLSASNARAVAAQEALREIARRCAAYERINEPQGARLRGLLNNIRRIVGSATLASMKEKG